MAAPKGNKYSTGRPKGTKNAKTEQWEELGHALITKHSERANRVLNNLDDDKFLDAYGKLLEYFKPKQSRQEVKQDGSVFHEVIVTRKEDGNKS